VHRRLRVVGALPRFLSHLIEKRRSKCEHAPRGRRPRYTPFHLHSVSLLTTTKAFRASAWPPPTLRTPLFARHSRRFTTRNRAPGRSKGRDLALRARRTPSNTVIRRSDHPGIGQMTENCSFEESATKASLKRSLCKSPSASVRL